MLTTRQETCSEESWEGLKIPSPVDPAIPSKASQGVKECSRTEPVCADSEAEIHALLLFAYFLALVSALGI